jgi:hypothetical protein
MTDIFFSYRSADRERVRPVRDAFAALGFEVFWDQQVPAGVDWDTWIRRHLAESKCAIVFWSSTSAASDNVRHEATIAKQQGKLIAALVEPLTAEQFPMGMYSQQAANLIGWHGDLNDAEWGKLRGEVEAKLIPRWMQPRIDELEAELTAERARREGAESRSRALRAQIAKEAEGDEDLRHERDKALDEVTALRATVQQLNRALSEANAQVAQVNQRATEVDAQRRAIEQRLQTALGRAAEAEVSPHASPSPARSRVHGLAVRYAIILIALAITGGSYVLWQSRQAIDAKTPPTSGSPPQNAAPALPASAPPGPSGATASFEILGNTEAVGSSTDEFSAASGASCQEKCAMSAACNVFTYDKEKRYCSLYKTAGYRPNKSFETGTRRGAAPGATGDAKAATVAFAIVPSMEGSGSMFDFYTAPSIAECQDRCAKTGACSVFSYSKEFKNCYLYRTTTLKPSRFFDSGTRK